MEQWKPWISVSPLFASLPACCPGCRISTCWLTSLIACLSVMFAQPLAASLCCILLTSATCYHTSRCVWVVCGSEWRTRPPTGEGNSEGLPPTSPSVSSELGLYFDTIGHQTAKVTGWKMGQGGWDGYRRDGETEVEVQVWSDWVWRDGASACPAVPKRKQKQTTTGSTDSTDFTKLQSRDTTERKEQKDDKKR